MKQELKQELIRLLTLKQLFGNINLLTKTQKDYYNAINDKIDNILLQLK